jgi:hypothetical protein
MREIKHTMEKKIIAIDNTTKHISKMKNYFKLFAIGAGLTLTTSLYIYHSINKFTT